ncbi:MAG: hypothetical protein ACYTBJ_26785 [Planctomycetota bacterium]
MWNMERQLLNPLIKKTLYRYMQFSKQRYQGMQDYEFCVKGTMGIVAREFEQAQLIGLLSNISPESPKHALVLKAIIEMSSSPKRDEILGAMAEMDKPDPEQQKMQQMMQQLQLEAQKETVTEQKLENEKTKAEIAKIMAEIEQIKKMTDLEDEKVEIQAANTVIGSNKVKIQEKLADIQREKNQLDANKAKEKSSG